MRASRRPGHAHAPLGDLAAGAHSATSDSRDGSADLASSRPAFTVTAASTLGKRILTQGLVVDLSRPRLYAPAGKSTTAGTSTRLAFKAAKPFSANVNVRYIVTDAKGRRVASGHPGWQPTGKSLTATWKPATRGVFTVTWQGVDLARNHEASTARTIVTVR